MSRIRKTSIIISLAITFTFCSVILYFSISKSTSKANNISNESLVTVIVASYDMKANSVVKEQDVKELKVPKQFVIQGAILKTEDIVGKLLKDNIYRGEQILNSNFFSSNDSNRLSTSIPAGQRAITLKIDAVNGLAGSINKGDYIDICSFVKPPYMGNETVVTIFENVNIIDFKAVGDSYLLTFYMKPEDINKLILVEEVSKIRISLRNISDRTLTPSSQIDTTILK